MNVDNDFEILICQSNTLRYVFEKFLENAGSSFGSARSKISWLEVGSSSNLTWKYLARNSLGSKGLWLEKARAPKFLAR